jgi:hypothetical protein
MVSRRFAAVCIPFKYGVLDDKALDRKVSRKYASFGGGEYAATGYAARVLIKRLLTLRDAWAGAAHPTRNLNVGWAASAHALRA